MFAKKNAPTPLSRSLEKAPIASLPRLLPWALIKVFLLATGAIFVAALAIAHKLTAAPIQLWVPVTPAPPATELEIDFLAGPGESAPQITSSGAPSIPVAPDVPADTQAPSALGTAPALPTAGSAASAK